MGCAARCPSGQAPGLCPKGSFSPGLVVYVLIPRVSDHGAGDVVEAVDVFGACEVADGMEDGLILSHPRMSGLAVVCFHRRGCAPGCTRSVAVRRKHGEATSVSERSVRCPLGVDRAGPCCLAFRAPGSGLGLRPAARARPAGHHGRDLVRGPHRRAVALPPARLPALEHGLRLLAKWADEGIFAQLKACSGSCCGRRRGGAANRRPV